MVRVVEHVSRGLVDRRRSRTRGRARRCPSVYAPADRGLATRAEPSIAQRRGAAYGAGRMRCDARRVASIVCCILLGERLYDTLCVTCAPCLESGEGRCSRLVSVVVIRRTRHAHAPPLGGNHAGVEACGEGITYVRVLRISSWTRGTATKACGIPCHPSSPKRRENSIFGQRSIT